MSHTKNRSKSSTSARVKTKGLSKVVWDAPLVSATFSIGANRGKEPENRKGFCAKQPKAYAQKTVDERVRALRSWGLMSRGVPKRDADKLFAASRVQQKGWFRGDPERSSQVTFYHDPSIPGEDTRDGFVRSMRQLAEMTSASLCQDEVIVTFSTPEGNRAEGVKPDPGDRVRAAALFSKRGRR